MSAGKAAGAVMAIGGAALVFMQVIRSSQQLRVLHFLPWFLDSCFKQTSSLVSTQDSRDFFLANS